MAVKNLNRDDCLRVRDMVEELVDWPKDRVLEGKSYYRAHPTRMLVLEMQPHHLEMIDREDWARAANRARCNSRRSSVRPGDYYGDVKNHADLMKRIKLGWPEGVEKAARLADQVREIAPVAKKKRRRPSWGAQGDEVNMQRVYSGQLDKAWRTSRRDTTEGEKIISIDVDICWNANVTADNLFWSGASAIALCDVLEEQGYRVELFATAVTEETRGVILSRLQVKRSHEPLNLNDVAMMAAHPAVFRYHMLNSWCRAPWDIGWGYGHAMHMDTALEVAVAEGVLEATDLQIKGALSEQSAVAAVEAGVKTILDRLEASHG